MQPTENIEDEVIELRRQLKEKYMKKTEKELQIEIIFKLTDIEIKLNSIDRELLKKRMNDWIKS